MEFERLVTTPHLQAAPTHAMPTYSDWRVDEVNGYWYKLHYRTGYRFGPELQLVLDIPMKSAGPLLDKWADVYERAACRTKHVAWRVGIMLALWRRRARRRLARPQALRELGIMLARLALE